MKPSQPPKPTSSIVGITLDISKCYFFNIIYGFTSCLPNYIERLLRFGSIPFGDLLPGYCVADHAVR